MRFCFTNIKDNYSLRAAQEWHHPPEQVTATTCQTVLTWCSLGPPSSGECRHLSYIIHWGPDLFYITYWGPLSPLYNILRPQYLFSYTYHTVDTVSSSDLSYSINLTQWHLSFGAPISSQVLPFPGGKYNGNTYSSSYRRL